MPARPYDPWRDVDGTPVPDQCRIEQIAVASEHGALPSTLPPSPAGAGSE